MPAQQACQQQLLLTDKTGQISIFQQIGPVLVVFAVGNVQADLV